MTLIFACKIILRIKLRKKGRIQKHYMFFINIFLEIQFFWLNRVKKYNPVPLTLF